MKKLIVAAGLAATMQTANAQGLHITGTVTATSTSISGAMNNRWNTTATTADTYIYANSSVSFVGHGADGTTFSCFVATTSACTNVYLLNGSYWLE